MTPVELLQARDALWAEYRREKPHGKAAERRQKQMLRAKLKELGATEKQLLELLEQQQ